MACGGCGQRENPVEAPIVGPAVIEGNGTVVPFETDEALDRWVAWRNTRHPGDPMTIIRGGESLAAVLTLRTPGNATVITVLRHP